MVANYFREQDRDPWPTFVIGPMVQPSTRRRWMPAIYTGECGDFNAPDLDTAFELARARWPSAIAWTFHGCR